MVSATADGAETSVMAPVEGLSLSACGRTATVTFPFQTLSRAFLVWFDQVLSRLERDSTIEAVILTGARSVFMTGADLPEVRRLTDEATAREFLALPHRLMNRLYRLDRYVIAAINGYCFGGGLEIALACDLRIAASDLLDPGGSDLPILGLPEARLGLAPALGGAWLLLATVGRSRGAFLLQSGEPVTAARAHEIGLVDRLAPRAGLADAAHECAASVLRNSRVASRQIKALARSALEGGTFVQALAEAGTAFTHCCVEGDKDDRIEGFRRERTLSFRARTLPESSNGGASRPEETKGGSGVNLE